MTEPRAYEGTNTARLDRVETEVAGLGRQLTEVRSDVRNFGGVLERIETTLRDKDNQVVRAQEADRSKQLPMIALLVTLTLAIVGGGIAYGSSTARLDERGIQNDKQVMQMHHEIDRLSDRQWAIAIGRKEE
jgi:hypothetical protein